MTAQGPDCQWRCPLHQWCHSASSFTNSFKDMGYCKVQAEQGEICHPHAALWRLSCPGGHVLATLTCEISKLSSGAHIINTEESHLRNGLFHTCSEVDSSCEESQGVIAIDSIFVYHKPSYTNDMSSKLFSWFFRSVNCMFTEQGAVRREWIANLLLSQVIVRQTLKGRKEIRARGWTWWFLSRIELDKSDWDIVYSHGSWERRNSTVTFHRYSSKHFNNEISKMSGTPFPLSEWTPLPQRLLKLLLPATVQWAFSVGRHCAEHLHEKSPLILITLWNGYYYLIHLQEIEVYRSYIHQVQEEASILYSQTDSKSGLSVTTLSDSGWKIIEGGDSEASEALYSPEDPEATKENPLQRVSSLSRPFLEQQSHVLHVWIHLQGRTQVKELHRAQCLQGPGSELANTGLRAMCVGLWQPGTHINL